MKLQSIFLSFLLIPTFLFCQKKSSIDIIGSADYSYRSLSDRGEDGPLGSVPDILQNVINERQDNELGRIKARVGFNYNGQLNQKLFFKTGIRLASIGWVEFRDDPLSTVMIKNATEHFFVDVPIAIRYELPQENFSFFIEVGLSPNIYLQTRTRDVFNDEVVKQNVDRVDFGFNRFHLVGSLSVGLNYDLNDKWQIFGQPIARYHFTSLVNKDTGIFKENLYTIGFEFGVRKFLQ